MRRLDHWIGKYLFVPVIIRICQAAGISQRAFHTYGWMASMLLVVATTKASGLAFALICVVAAGWVIICALRPDGTSRTDSGWCWFRMLILFFVGTDIVRVAVNGFEFGRLVGLIQLAAEYALTIKTIPPRETKKAVSGKLARQEN